MPVPTLPTGYDTTKLVPAGRPDCAITVGFDTRHQRIPRFLVQLHYHVDTDPVVWKEIARMDHNETTSSGHDIYQEGLHVDVTRQTNTTVKLEPDHSRLPPSRGTVIRACVDYLTDHPEYFIEVYEEHRPPGGPPPWSDGGGSTPPFISSHSLHDGMSQENPSEADRLSREELTTLLADAEGTTPDAIRDGAGQLEITPPSDATVLDE